MLHHNIRFDELLAEVSYNKDFEFNGKYVLTILITDYIRLVERTPYNHMPEDDFESLQEWLAAEHPEEKLEMWRFVNDQKEVEFYLRCGSRSSRLFMYYVLNHYNEKAVFKNPKNL